MSNLGSGEQAGAAWGVVAVIDAPAGIRGPCGVCVRRQLAGDGQQTGAVDVQDATLGLCAGV
ncbi:MAG TPA: hypothetical protein VJ714_02480 [Anaerolineae bacterium]|nr:hypothetical protein [Anaerolineae bacterium]